MTETIAPLLATFAPLAEHPLLPGLRLHQAAAILDIWQATEATLGREIEAPFWAFVWPGGAVVARCLWDHGGLEGRRVLDLACGGGVIGVAAAARGARVAVNDIDPLAVGVCHLNARANGVAVEELPGDVLALDPARLPFDVVCVGDAFYNRPFAERLWPWLRRAHAAGIEVWVGDGGRAFLPTGGLRLEGEHTLVVPHDVEGRPTRLARAFRVEGDGG